MTGRPLDGTTRGVASRTRRTGGRRPPTGLAALACALCALTALPAESGSAGPHVVAVGDIHGDLEAVTAILRTAGLIDEGDHWIGGETILVQTGDFTDRGPDVRPVMDLLMTLQTEAVAAGGRAVVVLGNHEVMNLLGEVRDVSPEAFASFADARSDSRRQAAYRAHIELAGRLRERWPDAPPVDPAGSSEAWMAAHPPGYLEYFEAFGPAGRYGRWLRSLPVVARVGDSIFMHAGIDPATAPAALDDINARAHSELSNLDEHRARMVRDGLILPFFTLQEMVGAARAEVGRLTPPAAEGAAGQTADAARPDPAAAGAGGAGDLEPAELANRAALENLLEIGQWSLLRPDGPLWFRGFSRWSDADGPGYMVVLLHRYDAARFVVAHTPSPARRILPRFSGTLFLIDTGMLARVYSGVPSALEIRGDAVTAVYLDERISLESRVTAPAPV